MVGIIENIVIIAIAFNLCTGPGLDHVGPSCDHAGPIWDISSGYVLVVLFNKEQFWSWSGHV